MILIRFCLDWGELSALARDPARQHDCCRRIVRAWSAHGILVLLGGEGGEQRLVETVCAMPQATRKLWQEAMKRLRNRITEVDGPIVEDLCSVQDLVRLAGLVELVGTDGDRAELFGLGKDELSREIAEHRVEISRVYCVDDALRMQEARRLAKADIGKGDLRDEVWAMRFAPLLPHSRHLVILDSYCGINASRSGDCGQSGLEFVLRQVWTTKVSIRVFMAEPKQSEPQYLAALNSLREAVSAMIDRLRRELGPRSASLAILRLPGWAFSRGYHDRYLRLDSWICDIGTGLEPFSGEGSRREATTFHLRDSTAEELEGRAKIERRFDEACSGFLEEPAVLAQLAHDEEGGN
jgi:hypothetical protein